MSNIVSALEDNPFENKVGLAISLSRRHAMTDESAHIRLAVPHDPSVCRQARLILPEIAVSPAQARRTPIVAPTCQEASETIKL